MISGYSHAHRDLMRPREVQPVNSAINSNTVSHICAFTTSSVSPTHHTDRFLPPLTFVLWLCAGDDPFDQAALHQSFAREPRLLPLPRILHSARHRLNAVGISQQAAIDHLAIRLEGGGGGRGGGGRERESSGQCGNYTNRAEMLNSSRRENMKILQSLCPHLKPAIAPLSKWTLVT